MFELLAFSIPFIMLIISLPATYVLDNGMPKIRRELKVKEIERKKRSWAAQKIIDRYNNLPVENQPSVDIISLVDAMDVKFQIDVVDNHFQHVTRVGTRGSWRCRAHDAWWDNDKGFCPEDCKFYPYLELAWDLDDILEAIETQKRELEIAGVQHDLDTYESIREQLQLEFEAIDGTTKALTAKS